MGEGVTDSNQSDGPALAKAGPSSAAPPGAADIPGGETTKATGFGLTTATALIIGSIIGVGIFNLPTSLASYGPISLVSMGLTTIGALALAMLFAALSRRLPADGGPYAYARVAYGNRWGFANAWSYWITAWAGNAAIAVGWVLYVEQFVNTGHKKIFSILLVLVGLWVSAAINLSGVKNMGLMQVVTTILKFFAVGFIAIVGLFYITGANYHPFNVSGEGTITAIGGGMAIALFSYLGVETRLGRRRQGSRSGPQHPAVDDFRHARDRGRVHALADRGVRDPAQHQARRLNGPVLRRRQRDVRRHLGRRRHVGAGDHLGHRGADRVDDDLRRDAARRRSGRPVPGAVQAHFQGRRSRVRDHRVDGAGVDRDDHQLPGDSAARTRSRPWC